MAEVGFPAGVVNIVPGPGPRGRAVHGRAPGRSRRSRSPASTATGRRIVQASAGNLKKVQLELGGKGANIVFEDAISSGGGRRFGLRDLPQPGPGVHRRFAARCCTRRSPTSSSRSSSGSRGRSGGQSGGPDDRDGPADFRRCTGIACFRMCKWRRKRVARSCSAVRHPTGPNSQRATTSSRPSSGPSPRIASRRKKCSGRSLPSPRSRPTSRGARDRQRHRVRPRRRPVDHAPAARAQVRARDEERHGLDQLLQARESGLAFRRRRQSAMAGRWASKRCANTHKRRACG